MVQTMNAIAVVFAPVVAGAIYRSNPYAVYSVSITGIILVLVVNLIIFGRLRKKQIHEPQA